MPLVVDAQVLSERVMALREDPSLPDDWRSNPTLRELVASGAKRRKWKIKIDQWVKGTSEQVIFTFRPAGENQSNVRVYSEAEDEGLPDIEVGKHYRFWLELDKEFGVDFYLSGAKPLS